MIVTRTPLRISFAGGGSDLPDFYHKFPGAVVSTAIDKYIYITVNNNFDDCIRLKYSQVEEVESVEKIGHNLIRESLKWVGVKNKIEITSLADIPVKGTGLGSSSAYLVGLLKALYGYLGKKSSPETLALEAGKIEMEILKLPVGKQDHYSAAFGGLNFIEFLPDGGVKVEALKMPEAALQQLNKNLLMFYTGITRQASGILSEQKHNYQNNRESLSLTQKMVQLAHQLKRSLLAGEIGAVGAILHENWELKKQLAKSISSSQIDDWYGRARKSGAEGGKLLGAGGGGFLLFYAPQDRHPDIIQSLSGLKSIEFKFEPEGSKSYPIN
jgi:D-glycero-alpha-D-manno-heptose-7-phosphate kinase